jgi:glycerol-3-phosphate cytidylyltransferase-like family protein
MSSSAYILLIVYGLLMSFLGKFRNRREYILKYKADVLVMGDDWKDKFNDICRIKYFKRVPLISTIEIIEIVRSKVEL